MPQEVIDRVEHMANEQKAEDTLTFGDPQAKEIPETINDIGDDYIWDEKDDESFHPDPVDSDNDISVPSLMSSDSSYRSDRSDDDSLGRLDADNNADFDGDPEPGTAHQAPQVVQAPEEDDIPAKIDDKVADQADTEERNWTERDAFDEAEQIGADAATSGEEIPPRSRTAN